MFRPLIESMSPNDIVDAYDNARQVLDDYVGKGKSTSDSTFHAYNQVSSNDVVKGILDTIRKGMSGDYANGLRYPNYPSQADYIRKYLVIIALTIPGFAEKLLELLDKVKSDKKEAMDKARLAFTDWNNIARSKRGDAVRNASIRFADAVISSVRIKTKHLKGSGLDADTRANEIVNNELDRLTPVVKSCEAFVYDATAEVGLKKENVEKSVDYATWMLIASDIVYPSAGSKIHDGRYSNKVDMLYNYVTTLDPTHMKDTPYIDGTERRTTNQLDNDPNNMMKKDLDAPSDSQWSILSPDTQFTANRFAKLFVANFSDKFKGYATKRTSPTSVIQRDILIAVKLLFNKCGISVTTGAKASVSPTAIDNAIKSLCSSQTEYVLECHDKMCEYLESPDFATDFANECKEFKVDSNEYKSFLPKLIDVICTVFIATGSGHIHGHHYIPEFAYCFGEDSPTDRQKTTSLTSIGKTISKLFTNTGNSVQIFSSSANSKFSVDGEDEHADGEDAPDAIDEISFGDLKAKAHGYIAPQLVCVSVGEAFYYWGVLIGIEPMSMLKQGVFDDAREIDPLTSETINRIGSEAPYVSPSNEKSKANVARVKAGLNRDKTIQNLQRMGFLPADSDVAQRSALVRAASALGKTGNTKNQKADETPIDVGDMLTRTAKVCMAFTKPVNAFLKACPSIKSSNQTKNVRENIYASIPKLESMLTIGHPSVTASVNKFLVAEAKAYAGQTANAELATAEAQNASINNLLGAMKMAKFLATVYNKNGGTLTDANVAGKVNTLTENVKKFLTVATETGMARDAQHPEGVISISSDDKDVATKSGNYLKIVFSPTTFARWEGWVRDASKYVTAKMKDIMANFDNPILDEEYANAHILIDGWNSAIDLANSKQINGQPELDTRTIRQVQAWLAKLTTSDEKGSHDFSKFNALNYATQALIQLRRIGNAATVEENSVELDEDFDAENVDLDDSKPLDLVSPYNLENIHNAEAKAIDDELDREPYTLNLEPVNPVLSDVLDVIAQKMATKTSYDKYSELLGEFSPDDESVLSDAQRKSAWSLKHKLKTTSETMAKLDEQIKSVLSGDTVEAKVAKLAYGCITSGKLSVNEVKSAMDYVAGAKQVDDSRTDTENEIEHAYTNSDASTISHVLAVMGEYVFGEENIDLQEVRDLTETTKQYVANASGNPASARVFDAVLDTINNVNGQPVDDQLVAFVKCINKIGPIVQPRQEDIVNTLNNTAGLHYRHSIPMKIQQKNDEKTGQLIDEEVRADNAIDAFARTFFRPRSMNDTEVVNDDEKRERESYSSELQAELVKNPDVALYAYNLGQAMAIFDRSLVNSDERYSDATRAARGTNSVRSSLVGNDMLFDDNATSIPQQILMNAIIDDERAENKDYKITKNTLSNLVGGANIEILGKEFFKIGEGRTAGTATDYKPVRTRYSFDNNKFDPASNGAMQVDEHSDELVASWFNPVNPIDASGIIDWNDPNYKVNQTVLLKCVKSAREYVRDIIVSRLGKIDDLTGEITVNQQYKFTDAMKAAIKSVYALANDMDTPIADVITATASIGMKNAQSAIVAVAKDALKNDKEFSVDKLGQVSRELNVFPERLSNELSTVDIDWVDEIAELVAGIPDSLSGDDVRRASGLFNWSQSTRNSLLKRDDTKYLYVMFSKLQSLNPKFGAPKGYFADVSGSEREVMEKLVNEILSAKAPDNTWKDAADILKQNMMEKIEQGIVDRTVGNDESDDDESENIIPAARQSSPARQKLAHLRRDPYYSITGGGKLAGAFEDLVDDVKDMLEHGGDITSISNGRAYRLNVGDYTIDSRTMDYWVKAIVNDLLNHRVELLQESGMRLYAFASTQLENMIMYYLTGVSPKYVNYVIEDANQSKTKYDDVKSLTIPVIKPSFEDDMVNIPRFGWFTEEVYQSMVVNAYDHATANGTKDFNPTAFYREFLVQVGVLTRRHVDEKDATKLVNDTPIYDVKDLKSVPPRVQKPKPEESKTNTPTVNIKPKKEPVPEPVPEEAKPDEDEEFVPTVYGAGE